MINEEDFKKLGYTDEETKELAKYAEYIDEMLPIESIDEVTISLIDKFNSIPHTSSFLTADQLRKLAVE